MVTFLLAMMSLDAQEERYTTLFNRLVGRCSPQGASEGAPNNWQSATSHRVHLLQPGIPPTTKSPKGQPSADRSQSTNLHTEEQLLQMRDEASSEDPTS